MSQVFDGASQALVTDSGSFALGELHTLYDEGQSSIAEEFPGAGTVIPDALLKPRGVLRSPSLRGALMGAPTTDIEVELYRLSAPTTLVEAFEGAKERTFQDWLNEPGMGSFALNNDDADLADIVGDGNDLVLFRYRSQAALMMICESFEKVTRSQEEEVAQQCTWTGRGHLALLERGLVYPSGGVGRVPIQDDRYFDWKDPSFDDGAWAFATVISTVGGAQTFWGGGGNTWDPAFPDATAAVLAPSSANPVTATVGHYYLRQDFTVADTGTYGLYGLADNIATIYIDGQQVVQIGQDIELAAFQDTTSIAVDLSAGTHTIAIWATNSALLDGGNNPTGVAWAMFRPDNLGGIGTLVAHSDSTAKIVEYPAEPPGMTIGQVMILALQEAQARGELSGITWTFTGTVDSEGVPWPVASDVATKVGTDVLTFFRELSTYAEIWMRPGSLELSAWNIGGRGAAKSVTLALNTNITSLIHRGEVNVITKLLARYHRGWAEREDSAAIALYGESAALIGLGAADHIEEVYRICDAQLDLFAAPREEIECGHEPASDAERPYLVHRPGDTITAPRASGSSSTERVHSLTLTQFDDNSNVEIITTLRDVILDADLRFAQLVKKMNNGALLGRAKPPQPVVPV